MRDRIQVGTLLWLAVVAGDAELVRDILSNGVQRVNKPYGIAL